MDKQRTSGQVDRALYDTVVRRYFAEKSAREELQRQLQEYRNPVKADDLKFIKGILCYLNKVFLPYSTKEGVAMCKKQVFDQQFSEKLDSADFGKLVLHIVIDKAVMRQRAAASLLGA